MNAFQYNRLAAHLAKLYDVPFYKRNGITYPVHALLPDPEQEADIDSVLGTLSPETPRDYVFYDHSTLHELLRRNATVYNGITYDMRRLETHPLRLHAHYGRYFDMIATASALENEAKRAVEADHLRFLLRTQYHRQVRHYESLFSGKGRSALIGGACLIVFATPTGDYALLAQRNSRSATDPNFYHLVPAFVFQPTHEQPHPDDWRMSYHIYREILEELFNVPEEQNAPTERVFQHPVIRDLADHHATLYLTGVTMNLLTLRPEVCALLYIQDITWWERVCAPTYHTPLNAHSEAHEGKLTLVPIKTDEALLASLQPDVHTRMPAHASVAMWLAVDLARKIAQH